MFIAAVLANPHLAFATGSGHIGNRSLSWPKWDEVLRVITLADYNTRIVVLGTTVLGLASGIILP